jgi:hypothetical protein
MTTKVPEVICEENLSYAWGRAFQMIMNGNKSLMPLTISIGGLVNGLPVEDDHIRQALDRALDQNNKYPCAVSAMTIFPFRYWNLMRQPNIHEFSDLYMNKYLPRLRARDSRNARGTYFERMVAFQGVRGKGGKLLTETKNQLEHIISLWPKRGEHPRPRQSALQAACFDPVKDHNGAPRSGFPCLQQVSFAYDDMGGLAINAYYPTQYIFDRAYGNYLGLCHLGHFMARELGLELVRFNCFIGRPELGAVNKSALSELVRVIEDALSIAGLEEEEQKHEIVAVQ